MSIDHGKLLALLSEVLPPRPLPGSIDSGSACSFTMSPLEIEQMHIRFDMLNSALAQPAEAVEPCRCVDCGGDMPGHSTDCAWMKELHNDAVHGAVALTFDAFRASAADKLIAERVEQASRVPVPSDVLEARAQGRAEALAIILGEDPECFADDHTGSHRIGCTGDYGTHWDEDKLRALLRADDVAWSLLQEAEGEYWHNLGLREEAERIYSEATHPQAAPALESPSLKQIVPDRERGPEPDPDTGADRGSCCEHAYADGWNDCVGEVEKRVTAAAQAAPAQEIEAEPASCVEADGCPTEMAVLQRFWRQQRAAPAQGDGEEWVAGYMQGANDYVGGAQGALDQDELRADAEMAQRHYAAELAAAPSPEPRS